MSRPQNLRHSVIDQAIKDMARGSTPSPLPSQSGLTETYNISRTTIRHILQHLSACSILVLVGKNYVTARKPERNGGFDCITASLKEQSRLFRQAFFTVINLRQLRAGESFSELQLARAASVGPVVVREYLLKSGCYNLIQGKKRGQQNMKRFDQSYAKQLFELHGVLGVHPSQRLLNPPDDDPRWLQVKTMLRRHRTLRDSTGSNFRMFSQLDRDFHAILLSAADNIFFNQSLEIISVIFHFHYQWDENDLRQRSIIAVDEHTTILGVLICCSGLDAITALRNHLDIVKQSMIRSIRQHHQ